MKIQTVFKRLKGFKSVSNMESARGNDVPNQYIVWFENGKAFFSYSSLIAVKLWTKDKGVETYLTGHWDYSNTTGKYRNDFLGENKGITLKKIDSGHYRLLEGDPRRYS